MIKRNKDNYLDRIPRREDRIDWSQEDEIVTLHLVHRGFYSWIAQKFFHRPKKSDVHLDRYGSFVWKQIDGSLTIFEIGKRVEEEFGDQAQPLYERLSKFFYILHQEKYIKFQRKVSRGG